jgi:hypothetical protein
MKRAVWIATAAAVACVASIGVSARDDDKSITVTGCVQNFSSTGVSGVTEHGFLLSNPTLVTEKGDAVPVPMRDRDRSATGEPTGTSGTAAAGMPTSGTRAATTGTTPAKPPKSYRLDGSDEELKAQVGHKVEIAGAIEPKNDHDTKGETDRLQVSKVKMLASDCTK